MKMNKNGGINYGKQRFRVSNSMRGIKGNYY